MKTITILFLLCLSCAAQNFAVLTHGAANTDEFKNGCPTNWPYRTQDIGASTNLPPDIKSDDGWVVLTKEALDDLFAQNADAKDVWTKDWENKNRPRTWTAIQFLDVVELITPGAWDRLDDAIANIAIPADARAQLRMARRKVNTADIIESTNPDFKKFMGAVVALGIISADDKDKILNSK